MVLKIDFKKKFFMVEFYVFRFLKGDFYGGVLWLFFAHSYISIKFKKLISNMTKIANFFIKLFKTKQSMFFLMYLKEKQKQ